jgi:hypothetical protein
MLRKVKLKLSYNSNALKDEFFQFLEETRKKVETEKGDDSYEINYQNMQEQDALFESPPNLESFEEKRLGNFNLFVFFLIELRE